MPMTDAPTWQHYLFNEYSITAQDYATVVIGTLAVCVMIVTVGSILFPEDKKKLAFCISACSSGTMSALGIYYYVTMIPTQEDFFSFGHLEESRFHGRNNFGCLLSTMFATILMCDLVIGTLVYPKQCDFLTTYFHHTLYVYFMYFSITGDGLFVTARPWTACFLNFLPAEIPTFLLALGAIIPKFRNDLLFGLTFFVTRIVMHVYLLCYAYLSGTDSIVVFFGSLTLLMHFHWFYGWFTKYGIYFLTGKAKPKKA